MVIKNNGNTLVDEQEELTREEIKRERSDTDKFLGTAFHVDKLGIIRPGIMVPKTGCPADKVAIYNNLVKKEVSWDDIDEAMGVDSAKKSWLVMKNVDYFTLRPDDCKNPEHAELLKKHYADEEGKLKRIPISFPFDDINMMINFSMSRYAGGVLQSTGKFVGNSLVCEKVDPSVVSKTLGPKPKIRTDCFPEKCPHFQKKECKLRGGFIFRIPKMPGLGVWAIYTTSYYSMVRLRSMMQVIQQIAEGRCGLHNVPNVFYLKKVRERVGSDHKLQWLLTIETDKDVDTIRQMIDDKYSRKNAVVAGEKAIRTLNGDTVDKGTGEVLDNGVKTVAPEQQTSPVENGSLTPQEQQKPAGSPVSDASKAPVSEQPPKEEGAPFDVLLAPFLVKAFENPIMEGASKISFWAGVLGKSLALFKKEPKDLGKEDILTLKGAVEADIADKTVTVYMPKNGQPSSTTPALAPAAVASSNSKLEGKESPLESDWPEPQEPQKTPSPAPASSPAPDMPAGKVSQSKSGSLTFNDLADPLGPYLEGVAKNTVFASVPDIRSYFEKFCKENFGNRSLAQLKGKEIRDFRNKLQEILKNGLRQDALV